MKIFCIGRNYVEHAKELNNAVPTQPMVFMKPATALVKDDRDVYYPEFTQDLHYELEVVLRICKNGKHVAPKFAHKYWDQLSLGIDFTARDVQQKCKDKGHPWEVAKAFDHSAPIGTFVAKEEVADLSNIEFSLLKNGNRVQHGFTRDLIFDFDTLISYISKYFSLQTGDLIYTGTPAGVGPVQVGDVLEGYLGERKLLHCAVK